MKFLSAIGIISIVLLFSCKGEVKQVEATINPKDSVELAKSIDFESINNELKANPNNAMLYIKRARLYQQYNDIPMAIEDIDRAIKIDSLVPDFYLLKAEFYKKEGGYAEAKRTLDKCMMIDNKNVQARIELGWMAFLIQNYKQALDYADAALKLNVYAAEAYYLKGMIFYEKNDTAKAISSYITAVEQEKNYYDAYIQLGLLHLNQPNTLAKEYFKNALTIKPKSGEALYNYGYACQIKGEYDEAILTYEKMIAIQPYREPLYNIAYINQEYFQKYDVAIDYYTRAIELSPFYFTAIYNRGLCFEKLGDLKNAENDFRKTLKIKSDYDYAALALERVLKGK